MTFWQGLLVRVLIVGAVLALLWVIWAVAAVAHDHYDDACCSGQDCRPLEQGEFKMEGGEWYLRNLQTERDCGWKPLPSYGLWDNKGRVRMSPDFSMHGCFNQLGASCNPICIYVGGGV